MLKRLAVLALCGPLAAIGILAAQDAQKRPPEQGIAKASTGQSGQTEPDPQDGKQATPKAVPILPPPSPPACDEACQQARENLQIQRELSVFTGLLVFVGVLQFATMYWQARLLRRTLNEIHSQAGQMVGQVEEMKAQTAIAQTSADAARKSTEALISAERAWVLASIRKTASPFPYTSMIAMPDLIKCELIFKNYGATPAAVDSYSCLTRWKVPPAPFPPIPEYGENHNARFVIAPGEEKTIGVVFPVEGQSIFTVESAIFIGYVTYGGIFEGQRKTAFCFGFEESLDAFISIGPISYNEAT